MQTLPRLFLLVATLAASALARAADDAPTVIKFSDPARPGTLKVQMARGEIRIQGADTAEVAVASEAKPVSQKRKDGLRVLASSTGYSLTEKDNVVTLDALSDGWKSGATNFTLTVPRNTQVVVHSSFGGVITCTDLGGDLEINNMNGEIVLEGNTGGAVVQTMNGSIKASIPQLTEGKPLSFTSMNGEIALRVAPTAKANLRFRTQNGAVLTDFPEEALVTRTESAPRTPGQIGVLPAEARNAIREASRVAVEAAREVEAVMREAAAAARDGLQEARATDPERPRTAKPPAAPRPPKAPIAPTVTGGKLLTGTLNGGGPEISVATMNGDVILRRLDK